MSLRRALLTLALAPLALGLLAGLTGQSQAGTPQARPLAAIPAPDGTRWSEVIEQTADGGIRMGNPQAPVKLVEYASLSCPFCEEFSNDAFATLVGSYVASGRVSFEFRSYAIHPQDVPLTVLVRCAPTKDFFPLVEAIFTNFDAMNAVYDDAATLQSAEDALRLPPAQRWAAFSRVVGYTRFFAEHGLPEDQAEACLADSARVRQVADYADSYTAQGVVATPTFTINGQELADVEDWKQLRRKLDARL